MLDNSGGSLLSIFRKTAEQLCGKDQSLRPALIYFYHTRGRLRGLLNALP